MEVKECRLGVKHEGVNVGVEIEIVKKTPTELKVVNWSKFKQTKNYSIWTSNT